MQLSQGQQKRQLHSINRITAIQSLSIRLQNRQKLASQGQMYSNNQRQSQVSQYHNVMDQKDFQSINSSSNSKGIRSPSKSQLHEQNSQLHKQSWHLHKQKYYQHKQNSQLDRGNSLNLFDLNKLEYESYNECGTLLNTQQGESKGKKLINNMQNPFNSFRYENLKQSKIQEFHKVLNQNRLEKRIPFKQKEVKQLGEDQRVNQKGAYDFYQPHYDQYYVRGEKNFWTYNFEKYYQKKGSLQNLSFTNLHLKDNPKASENLTLNQNTNPNVSESQKITQKAHNILTGNNLVYILIVLCIIALTLKLTFQQ